MMSEGNVTQYVFTAVHALVFCRYIQYNYNRIMDTQRDWHAGANFSLQFKRFKCTVYPEMPPLDVVTDTVTTVFEIVLSKYQITYLSMVIRNASGQVSMEAITEQIMGCVGKTVRLCLCDAEIDNPDMDRCEACFIFSHIREEPCCICLENDYSWVRLKCDCTGGRVIHRHCFYKLPISEYKKKCPCCRKSVSFFWGGEVEMHPDFAVKNKI